MSTDEQQFSIDNQKAAIEEYAKNHNFHIVASHVDAGNSGLHIKQRDGLRQLLRDVVTDTARYRAILVYVSRWGRFQDADESAHYEFLCRHSGRSGHYCAEPFVNDGALPGALMKALKRTMAGEYSRELGVKVFKGKQRLVELGFRVGGSAGFGLRRMMVSDDGRRKRVLQRREYKYLETDRIILVPGPKAEVNCVREIFDMALRHVRPAEIARELNKRGISNEGGLRWGIYSVIRLLKNPKYCGCNVWNRTSCDLGSSRRLVSEESWVRKPNAFTPIVDPETFERVQTWMRKRTEKVPQAYLLKRLKGLLAKKGRLSSKIIDETPGMPRSGNY
jgi:DNA invertase Pin-like site-specific DNA recombinase